MKFRSHSTLTLMWFLLGNLCISIIAHAQDRLPALVVRQAMVNERLSQEWKDALQTRMSRERIDSFAAISRAFTSEEESWKDLVQSKIVKWNSTRDSLQVPFGQLEIPDTIIVLLGYLGTDDGFTYRYNTVCLDLTALQRTYGDAGSAENVQRIDRLFSHEYTHLLHKAWARKTSFNMPTFGDSILWECIYEGIGMYRSLHPRWLPVNGQLPEITRSTLEKLYPIFVDRLTRIKQASYLSEEEKNLLNTNLSRGSVPQKWGAFTVAIWFALEAAGDDKNLRKWIDLGPPAVILLAKKYLDGEQKEKFLSTFR